MSPLVCARFKALDYVFTFMQMMSVCSVVAGLFRNVKRPRLTFGLTIIIVDSRAKFSWVS